MADQGFWGAIFGGQPATVLDYYNKDAQNLAATRLANIKNALGQIQLNYAPQMAQQAADKGAADVSIEQNKAKYAPLMSQLDAAQKQIANNMSSLKFQEQPALFQADQTLKYAQINKIKNAIQNAPQRDKTAALNAAARVLNLQKGPAANVFNATHQDLINNLSTSALGNALNITNPQQTPPGGAQQGGPTGTQQPISSPGIAAPQPIQPISPFISKPPMAQGMAPSGAPSSPTFSSGTPPSAMANAAATVSAGNAMLPDIPKDQISAQYNPVQLQQMANQVKANMGGVSPKMTAKLDNVVAIDKFVQSPAIQMLAESAKDYSGIKGKGQAFLDRWTGNNSIKFENNLEFRNSFTSDLVNLQRNLEALSIQPSQRKELITNIRGAFDDWSTNPERAIDQFNRAMAQLKDISGGVSVAGQPFFPGTRERLAGLPPPSTNNLANYVESRKRAVNAINLSHPGYLRISGNGQSGWIKEDEWNNASEAVKKGYEVS